MAPDHDLRSYKTPARIDFGFMLAGQFAADDDAEVRLRETIERARARFGQVIRQLHREVVSL